MGDPARLMPAWRASAKAIRVPKGELELESVRERPPSDNVGQNVELEWRDHGQYQFTGRDEPMKVFEAGAKGLAPLRCPVDSAKAPGIGSFEEQRLRSSLNELPPEHSTEKPWAWKILLATAA